MTTTSPETSKEPSAVDRLSSIWKQLLGHDSFGPDDNFFDVGGHSLIANRLCLAIEERFGVHLPVIDIFDHPTIKQLSARVQQAST
jgi:acyl carrier protein